MIPRIQSLPVLAKSDDASSGWVGRIAQQVDIIKDILTNLAVGNGLEMNVDGMGRVTIDLIGAGMGGDAGNYGFRTFVEDGYVYVAAGTAQVWGGAVKTYEAVRRPVGTIPSGGNYVYATCNLNAVPPAWGNALEYDEMTGQVAGDEIWVPIAKVEGSAQGGYTVTQLHWGNIVIPAVANVVDVQQPSAATSEGGDGGEEQSGGESAQE